MPQFEQQTTVTTPQGKETVIKSTPQGFVVGDGQAQQIVFGFQTVDSRLALVMHDGTTYRLILGQLPDDTIGLAISKPGQNIYDAFTA